MADNDTNRQPVTEISAKKQYVAWAHEKHEEAAKINQTVADAVLSGMLKVTVPRKVSADQMRAFLMIARGGNDFLEHQVPLWDRYLQEQAFFKLGRKEHIIKDMHTVGEIVGDRIFELANFDCDFNTPLLEDISSLGLAPPHYATFTPEAVLSDALLLQGAKTRKRDFMGAFNEAKLGVAKSTFTHSLDVLLNTGEVFLKPADGARANGIMRVRILDDALEIYSVDMGTIAGIHGSTLKIRRESYAAMRRKETEYSRIIPIGEGINLAVNCGSVLIDVPESHIGFTMDSTVRDGKIVTDKFHPKKIFAKDITVVDKNTLRIARRNMTPEQQFEDLALLVDYSGNWYAEESIAQPLYCGKTWETRGMYHPFDDSPKLVGVYVKTGNGINNISTGGSGVKYETVMSAMQKTHGVSLEEYTGRWQDQAQKVIKETGSHFHSLQEKHFSGTTPIRVGSLGLDFLMRDEDFSPVLVDIGFQFGYSGADDKTRENVIGSLHSRYDETVHLIKELADCKRS
jgi:hypothetical protein